MSTRSESSGATVIHIGDASAAGKSKTAATTSSSYATAPSSSLPPPVQQQQRKAGSIPFLLRSGAEGLRRCVALLDFLLRVAAFGPALAAAISTATSDETLSVFTQLFQFHARFDDFPAFTFFMVANAVAAGYLLLSLPFAVVGVARPKATGAGARLLLLVCDTLMVGLLTAAAAAAAAIVYVAHWGNLRANWVPICMQFHGFCQRTSGAVVASFLADLLLLLLVIMGAAAIRKR